MTNNIAKNEDMSIKHLVDDLKKDMANIVRQNFLATIDDIEEYLLRVQYINAQNEIFKQTNTKILFLKLYATSDKYLRSLSYDFLSHLNNVINEGELC